MAKSYITPISPVTVTASSSAANFPATNILTPQVLRPWKSAAFGNQNFIIDLGSSQLVIALGLQDVNFSVATVTADNTSNPTTVVGSYTPRADKQNRYRALVLVGATVRYIKVAINGAGGPFDNDTSWRCAAAFVFSASYPFPLDPLYGNSTIDNMKPQSRVDLDNGVIIKDDTGPGFALVTFDHSGGVAQPMEQVAEYARKSLIWVSLDENNGEMWPMRHFEPKITRKKGGYNRESVQFVLKEEV